MKKMDGVTASKIANRTGIPKSLIDWRITHGFPINHMHATEMVDGVLVAGEFDMPQGDPEKTDKNPVTHSYPPRHIPDSTPKSPNIKITIKKSKLKK